MSSAVETTTAAPAPAPKRAASSSRKAGIASLWTALPDRVVPNAEIAARIGVDDEWIASRTGVSERRHAAEGATLADLATEAGFGALSRAGIAPDDLDQILVATSTADERVPTAAPLVAQQLEAVNAGAIDIGAACTGFVSALDVAAASIEAGRARASLVIGAELMSRVLDLDDKRTAGLFGDGAGAVVVVPGGPCAIGPVRLRADGAGSRAVVATHDENVVRMDGRATFRAAVTRLSEVTRDVAADAGLGLEDIDVFVYHQANARILTAVGERLDLDPDKVVNAIATHGNTSAASIPLALGNATDEGLLRPGANVFLGAFGAGLTWGGAIVEWGDI